MFLYIFIRFMFNPKLLLTELRSGYSGLLSLVAAWFAVATFILANDIIYRVPSSPLDWLLGSLRALLVLILIALLYLPVVHLFVEKRMPNARVSDLLVYSGFALSPLYFALPAAFILALFRWGWLAYSLVTVILIARIAFNLFAGVRDNYRLSLSRACLAFFAPVLSVIGFSLLVLVLSLAA